MLLNTISAACVCETRMPSAFLGYRDVAKPVGALENLRGNKAGNVKADVLAVQEMLNLVAIAQGGQMGPGGAKGLVEDGIIGKFTRGAIVTFQKKQFPDKNADGVIEPAKRSIYRLNLLAYTEVDETLRARAKAEIAQAARYIRQGRHIIDQMRHQLRVPSSLFSGGKAERLLNYHFRLDKSTDKQRDLDTIDRVLSDMHIRTAHVPSGPNQREAFGFIDSQPASYAKDPPYAFAFGGGFHYLQGRTIGDMFPGGGTGLPPDMRMDLIYLTRRVLTASVGTPTYVIMHELAHHVGGRMGDIDHVTDHAYWHRQQSKYERLTTYQCMTNADCYSQFCWEAATGTHFRP